MKVSKKTLKQETIDTYNRSAKELAEYFQCFGLKFYKGYIDKIFSIYGRDNPKVLEIGCGDGRDAEYILQKTNNYTGLDISARMVKLAKERKLSARFMVADIENYKFTKKYDIILGFGVLLHSNKKSLERIFFNIAKNGLREKGLLFISLKSKGAYKKIIKEDQFGKRIFYFYPAWLVREISRKYYQEVYYRRKKIGNTVWLQFGLQKK
jgi:SAM-dependent methyltransferase